MLLRPPRASRANQPFCKHCLPVYLVLLHPRASLELVFVPSLSCAFEPVKHGSVRPQRSRGPITVLSFIRSKKAIVSRAQQAARLEEEKKARMEKIRQIKAQMQDDDGFIVETKTSFFGLVKTVTRVPKPTLEERLTEAIAPHRRAAS